MVQSDLIKFCFFDPTVELTKERRLPYSHATKQVLTPRKHIDFYKSVMNLIILDV
jgi:hypothetical protein